MVDCSDVERLAEVKMELHRVVSNDVVAATCGCVLVFANKQDLPNAVDSSALIHELELNKLRVKWYCQPSIASQGKGLYEGLDWMNSALMATSKKY